MSLIVELPDSIKDILKTQGNRDKLKEVFTDVDTKDLPNLISKLLDSMVIDTKQPHKEIILEKFTTEELKEQIAKRELTYEPKVVQEKILSQCTVEELNQEIERRNYTKRVKLLVIYTTEELKQEIARREIRK
jgi:hypothetical protein